MLRDRAVLLALSMTILQHYDYGLFGLSALWLSHSFMPPTGESVQLTDFWIVFATSVLIRPIGSLLFGSIGDIYGRSILLKVTGVISALSTLCIGLLPSFDYLGNGAIWSLLILRMLFLASLSGKSDGTRVYLAEKVGTKSELIANGVMSFCGHIGTMGAAAACYFVDYMGYSWRLNFIFGGILGLAILLYRTHLTETAEFTDHKARHPVHLSFKDLLKRYKAVIFYALIIMGGIGGSFNLLIIFLTSFVKSNQIALSMSARTIVMLATIIYGFSAIIGGLVGTYWRKESAIKLLLSVQIISYIYQTNSLSENTISHIVHLISVSCLGMYAGLIQITIKNLLHVRGRVRVLSLAHSLGSMLFSAPAPFLVTQLISYSHSTMIYGVYLTLLSTLVALCYLRVIRIAPPVM